MYLKFTGILSVYWNLVTLRKICSGFSLQIILTRIKAISPNDLLATKFTIQGQKILMTAYEKILRKLMNKDIDIFHLHALINPLWKIRRLVFTITLLAQI